MTNLPPHELYVSFSPTGSIRKWGSHPFQIDGVAAARFTYAPETADERVAELEQRAAYTGGWNMRVALIELLQRAGYVDAARLVASANPGNINRAFTSRSTSRSEGDPPASA